MASESGRQPGPAFRYSARRRRVVADRCGSIFPAGRFTVSWVLFIALPCLGLAPVESAPPTFSRSVAVMEVPVADRSPAPDVARTGASPAARGNTPPARLAGHLPPNR